MPGENLENAVSPVELERKCVRVLAPIPLRLLVEPTVQDQAKVQHLVMMAHALVSDLS